MAKRSRKDWVSFIGQIVVPVLVAIFTFLTTYYFLRPAGPALGADISPSTAAGPAPLWEAFSTIVTGGSPPYNYSWQFGDGGTSNSATPIHTFNSPGHYLVQVWVRDSTKQEAHAQTTVLATLGTQLTVYITGPGNVSEGSAIAFTAHAGGGTPPYTYTWQFGDGTISSTNSNPADHTYATTGQFNVSVVIDDANGATAQSNVILVNVSGVSSAAIPTFPAWTFGVAGLVVVAVVVGALFFMRRTRRQPPLPPPPGWTSQQGLVRPIEPSTKESK